MMMRGIALAGILGCLFAFPVSGYASIPGAATSKSNEGRQSLRKLFIDFLDEEVARRGRQRVLESQKEELFRRFLIWQARRLAE